MRHNTARANARYRPHTADDQTTGEHYVHTGRIAYGIFKTVFPYLWLGAKRDNKVRIVIALLLLFLANASLIWGPFFYKQVVDTLHAGQDIKPLDISVSIFALVVLYGGALWLNDALNALKDTVFAPAQVRVVRIFAVRILKHIHTLSMRFHISRKTGEIMNVINLFNSGCKELMTATTFHASNMVLQFLGVASVIAVLFDWRYLAVIVVMYITHIVFTIRCVEKVVFLRKQSNQKYSEGNQKAIDGLLNFETIRYFNTQKQEVNRYKDSILAYGSLIIRRTNLEAFMNVGQATIVAMGLLSIFMFGVADVQSAHITVGEFAMVYAYVLSLIIHLGFVTILYRRFRSVLEDMYEGLNILDESVEINDVDNASVLQVPHGAIRFENVGFAYNTSRQILNSLHFSVPAGHKVAIVGASGSGKTTIARLLFRFYDVQSGKITIDGQDISTVTQHSLHSKIGVIPQDTVLFNDTLWYNLTYGCENPTLEQVQQVAKDVMIYDFIMELPDGYNTMVGERGLKLSGGEKQRVAIARAMLKNPPILVLDEATSSLDSHTESEIQQNLHALSQGRTVIAIAHRLSTIVDSDTIIVVEKGQIIQQGTHAQLLNQDGTYKNLWMAQV